MLTSTVGTRGVRDPFIIRSPQGDKFYQIATDLRTFSAAQVWVDKGYSTIDSTLIKHNGTYHRFTKDERGSSQSPAHHVVTNRTVSTVAGAQATSRRGHIESLIV